jgi:ribulose-phosphate 3-epimerase
MHLMVTNPIFHIRDLSNCSIHNVTVHWEAVEENWPEVISEIKKSYKSAGLSIKPETNLNEVPLALLEKLDLLLIMSVEPGFYGQKFIEGSIAKVREAHELKKSHKFKFDIQVDGGVSKDNLSTLRTSGANNFVAGNSVFKHEKPQYKKAIDELRQ